MKRVIIYILFISAIAYFSSCCKKVICPAYHSYFILDVDETKKTFSMFGVDSLPKKNWEIEQEKYGIAKDISDAKKQKEMDIISMNSIYLKLEDPFEQIQREFAKADSLYGIDTDSVAVLAQSENYNDFQNIDQMIYLHHFGKYLPKKGRNFDKELKEDLKEEEPLVPDVDLMEGGSQKKKRKLWPFGKTNKKSNDEQSQDLEKEEQ